jgi:bifunctional DNA-binding transcriptional regulator/antitoxin component of YhaV-PrlF toxin-antitoxin module
MPTVKIHYDGWICLPTGLCRALGLNPGDRLAAELVEGELVLQPVAGRAGRTASVGPDGSLPAKRKRGRPRKDAVAEPAAAPKKRGRPRKVVAAAEPEPVADQPSRRPACGASRPLHGRPSRHALQRFLTRPHPRRLPYLGAAQARGGSACTL